MIHKKEFLTHPDIKKSGLRKATLYCGDSAAFFVAEYAYAASSISKSVTLASPADFAVLTCNSVERINDADEMRAAHDMHAQAARLWSYVRRAAREAGLTLLDDEYSNLTHMNVYVRSCARPFTGGNILVWDTMLRVMSEGEYNCYLTLRGDKAVYLDDCRLLFDEESNAAYVDFCKNEREHIFVIDPLRFDGVNNASKMIRMQRGDEDDMVFSFMYDRFGCAIKSGDDVYRSGYMRTADECLKALEYMSWDFSIEYGKVPRCRIGFPYALYTAYYEEIHNAYDYKHM